MQVRVPHIPDLTRAGIFGHNGSDAQILHKRVELEIVVSFRFTLDSLYLLSKKLVATFPRCLRNGTPQNAYVQNAYVQGINATQTACDCLSKQLQPLAHRLSSLARIHHPFCT
jgi:hypothetical protein